MQSKYQNRPPAGQVDRIRHLEARFGGRWAGMGAVAEAFGLAYAEAKATDKAITWYAAAVQCNDGSASMKATEQWLNLRARQALAVPASAMRDAKARTAARADINAALQQLQALVMLQPTIERHSLCGSAWKRLAMLEQRGGDEAAAATARAQSATSYEAAEALAIATRHPELFYPALNRMAAALAAHPTGQRWHGFDSAVLARVRASLQEKISADPDFWSMVGVVEVDAFEAVANGELAAKLDPLLERLRDLKQRVAAPHMWASVADNASYALDRWRSGAAGAERAAIARWQDALKGYAVG